MVELHSLEALAQHRAEGRALAGAVLQGLDLRGQAASLLAGDVHGAVLLGCQVEPAALAGLVAHGALVFPPLPGLPFQPYRHRLYTPEELYAGFDPARPESYAETPDARIYLYWKERGGAGASGLLDTLAQRLHDHAVTDALDALLAGVGKGVVAVMGGHSLLRDSEDYRAVAQLSRQLARRGLFLVSGGGPGAMEATHLGAWFARRGEAELDAALAVLSRAPGYQDRGWLSAAFEVRHRWPLGPGDVADCASLGIPTWFYGHEPPNPFATHVAKYFANSVREEGLLTIAKGGVVFTPGSAGTLQEVFQDACQNHYGSVGVVSPMVFLGVEFWTRTRPAFPLLQDLARGRDWARHLHVTDAPAEVARVLLDFDRARRGG